MKRKVLFLIPYPLKESPSQRFRFEQYFSLLTDAGYKFHVQTFLNSHNWKVFYQPGQTLRKIWAIASGYLKRLMILLKSPMYDFIFIHREATPLGPPFVEWILTRILKKKVIYDFDDAIWLTDRLDETGLVTWLKWRGKVRSICKWSYKVSCGNEYLCSFARQFNRHVIYNPTTIDTENLHNPALFSTTEKLKDRIVIGWTGSHSTLKYLNMVEGVLKKILSDHPQATLLVIADRKPSLGIPLQFLPWRAETEIQDLLSIDIGIMPLPDDEWAKGKCGFKALQYMALMIPSVISPVGVNTSIVDHGSNGFLAAHENDWYTCLSKLISDESLRRRTGEFSRRTVEANYSVRSNTAAFLSLFT